MHKLRIARSKAGMTLMELEAASGVGASTISKIERGVSRPQANTLHKLAEALGVEVGELYPKAQSTTQPEPEEVGVLLEEERRAVWEAAVDEARRVRDTGWAQMWGALSEWRASRDRGEPYAARRKYLDEMGSLLQEVYDADTAVGWAYIHAARSTPGGSKASVPSYLRELSYLQEQSRETTQFYGKLLGLLESAGLSVRAGEDAAAAKQAAAENVQSETTPLRVEEPRVA